MRQLQPIEPTDTSDVSLPKAPLARVISQVRFPTILAVGDPDRAAVFQEALRTTYPYLDRRRVKHVVADGRTPEVRDDVLWSLVDKETESVWGVSLGVDFVTLDTTDYEGRPDFLNRLRPVLAAAEEAFEPVATRRLGVRYLFRLTGEPVERISELVRRQFRGLMDAPDDPSALNDSAIHAMTDAEFVAPDQATVQVRWGHLPPGETHDPSAVERLDEPSWVLDLDMFTWRPQSFDSDELVASAEGFAECLYWVFREIVTDEFMRLSGDKP